MLNQILRICICNACLLPATLGAQTDSDRLNTLLQTLKQQSDSTVQIVDRLIASKSAGTLTEETLSANSVVLNSLHIRINQNLRRAPALARELRLSKEAYEQIFIPIGLQQLVTKMNALKKAAIFIDGLPFTHPLPLDQAYIDTIRHFSLRLPAGWSVHIVDSVSRSMEARGSLQLGKQSPRDAEALLQVRIVQIPADFTNEKHTEEHIRYLEQEANGFVLHEQYDMEISGTPAIYLRYSLTAKGQPTQAFQVHTGCSGKKYVLTGAVSDWQQNAADFQELLIAIARTFEYSESRNLAMEGKLRTAASLREYMDAKAYDQAISLFSAKQQENIRRLRTNPEYFAIWCEAWTFDQTKYDYYTKVIRNNNAYFVLEDGMWKINER